MCISVSKMNRCQNTKKSEPSVLEGLILLRDFNDDVVFPIANRVSLLTSPFITDWRSIFGSWWKSLTSSFLRNTFDSWTFCCLASSLILQFLSWYKMPASKNINAYNTANTNMHSFRRIFLLTLGILMVFHRPEGFDIFRFLVADLRQCINYP